MVRLFLSKQLKRIKPEALLAMWPNLFTVWHSVWADGLRVTLGSKRRANKTLFASQYKRRTKIIRMINILSQSNIRRDTCGQRTSQLKLLQSLSLCLIHQHLPLSLDNWSFCLAYRQTHPRNKSFAGESSPR